MAEGLIDNPRGRFELAIANALWVQTGYRLQADYLRTVLEVMGAEAQELDLVEDPESACRVINGWADRCTKGKISEILRPDEIGLLTHLILTNATYFKAAWVMPFNPSRAAPFHLLDGTDVDVAMMSQSIQLPYLERDGLQVVEFPYAGVPQSLQRSV